MSDDMFSDESLNNDKLQLTKDQMVALRRRLGFTQPIMAEHMGLSKSAYVAIETGTAVFRRIHALAAERVAEKWAHRLDNPQALPYPVYADIRMTLNRWSLDELKAAQIAVVEGKVG